ncbi:MAG: hypothetical protein SAJ12_00890 [Jaaginema sp. PMC 1079.18]|nr:hypothetical protein [Jaaginema sp. PMC 1080.18]MEC4849540.1 hypothetical protein [Jaaginema sp. PMC 1079.18]MEC4865732.1 hypothetical protein [Jaaginema sp. PMC 1078.18]
MILDLGNQGIESVQHLFDYATLYEVLYSLQHLEAQQGSEYTDTMTSELLKTLESDEGFNGITRVLTTLREAQSV